MITEQDMVRSPAWLPLAPVSRRELQLIRLDEAGYRAASFLDQRLLGQGLTQETCPTETVRAAAAQLSPNSYYIFHTGHAGSTLLARLIGEHPDVFCLREPALLRAQATGSTFASVSSLSGELDLWQTLALLSRPWRPGQRTVIKATSFVSELAAPILSLDTYATAFFLFTEPLSYLRTILAGANSRLESQTLAPTRLQRLRARLSGADWPDPVSEGEQIAMAWLCEMSALHEAALRTQKALWLNFDAFLLEPRLPLGLVLKALGVAASPAEVEALVYGPVMRQYSKDPGQPYDVELRRRVQQAAGQEHAEEIRRGLDWLTAVAQRHPLAGQVLNSASHITQTQVTATSHAGFSGLTPPRLS